jgi:subtilisin family serine protease
MKNLAVVQEKKLTVQHGFHGYSQIVERVRKQFARLGLAAILLCFLLGSAAGQPVVSAGQMPQQRPGRAGRTPEPACTPAQWIVKLKEPAGRELRLEAALADPQAAQAAQAGAAGQLSAAAGTSLQFVREMSGGAFVFAGAAEMVGTSGVELEAPSFRCISLEQAQAAADGMMRLPEVEYAEVDRILTISRTPNDPQYGSQWHYAAPMTNNYGINAPAAWDITTGSASVVVAVVDTGYTNHADLAGRILPGYDMISSLDMANDGGGRDSDASDPGDWVTANYCYAGAPGMTSSWHGTHVAGTIGANTNNGAGVAGVNWAARILPVRVLGLCGGTMSDISDGIRWAAGVAVPGVPANPTPADVINVSITGVGSCGFTEQSAINEAVAAGATVVIAAGNNGDNASFYTPASCSGAITVAATDRTGDLADYSNWSTTLIELSAPGGDTSTVVNGVLSTLNAGLTSPAGDTYAYYQGTSMAAPHVAGVASLLYGMSPNLTPTQVRQILQGTVTAFPASSTCPTYGDCGSGIVNAGAAVGALPRVTGISPNRANTSTSLTLTVDGVNFVSGAVVRWNGTPLATTFVNSTRLTALLTTGSVSGVFPVSVTQNTTYGSLSTLSKYFGVGLNYRTLLPFAPR